MLQRAHNAGCLLLAPCVLSVRLSPRLAWLRVHYLAGYLRTVLSWVRPGWMTTLFLGAAASAITGIASLTMAGALVVVRLHDLPFPACRCSNQHALLLCIGQINMHPHTASGKSTCTLTLHWACLEFRNFVRCYVLNSYLLVIARASAACSVVHCLYMCAHNPTKRSPQ